MFSMRAGITFTPSTAREKDHINTGREGRRKPPHDTQLTLITCHIQPRDGKLHRERAPHRLPTGHPHRGNLHC
nr:hypothetical protein Q903MT_gene798 [Picea sitchensis]